MTNSISVATLCPYCESKNLIQITKPEERTIHYGRLECFDCKKFIKWLRDPVVETAYEQRQEKIDLILSSGRATGWANYFLRSIRTKRHLSSKQQSKLTEIFGAIGNVVDAPPLPIKNPNLAS